MRGLPSASLIYGASKRHLFHPARFVSWPTDCARGRQVFYCPLISARRTSNGRTSSRQRRLRASSAAPSLPFVWRWRPLFWAAFAPAEPARTHGGWAWFMRHSLAPWIFARPKLRNEQSSKLPSLRLPSAPLAAQLAEFGRRPSLRSLPINRRPARASAPKRAAPMSPIRPLDRASNGTRNNDVKRATSSACWSGGAALLSVAGAFQAGAKLVGLKPQVVVCFNLHYWFCEISFCSVCTDLRARKRH